MNGYLVDTNVISELRRGDRANPGVRAWMEDHAGDDLWLSVLVVGELRRGVELVRRRDPLGVRALDTWLVGLELAYGDRVLPISLDVCRQWAVLGIPDPVPVVDGLLAATALVHGLTLVTRNERDVQATGVRFENPFAA